MDCSNGNIGSHKELLANGSAEEDIVPIRTCDATRKQLEQKRVSKHDHRSVLGKLLTKNQRKRQRQKRKQR